MKLPILGLYAGTAQPIPDDGRPSAIFKHLLSGRVAVGVEGLAGDMQADRRVHGGPEKAVHHFPAENYRRLAQRFPQLSNDLVPGVLGENLSTEGADESAVCIGDVFALGDVRLQLCQPRTPCWKIDARLQLEGVTRFLAETGAAGWYYRVLAPGTAEVGGTLELLERAAEPVSLQKFWAIVHAHRPSPEELDSLLQAPGLAEGWRRKLTQRRDWLRAPSA